jgi:hypothetical protein
MKHALSAGLVAVMLAGCASIFSGTTQEVAIRTTPGTKYTVRNYSGQQVAVGLVGEDSTARFDLQRGVKYFSPHAYQVSLSQRGYRPTAVNIDPGINPWYFGNILLGGLIGMVIVDPLTGAMYRMVPRTDEAMLIPTGEDIEALDREDAVLHRTRGYPVSRHDYTARQVLKATTCAPLGNALVERLNSPAEQLTFECRDGRKQVIACNSGVGCRVL